LAGQPLLVQEVERQRRAFARAAYARDAYRPTFSRHRRGVQGQPAAQALQLGQGQQPGSFRGSSQMDRQARRGGELQM